jgi:hypothetical protein
LLVASLGKFRANVRNAGQANVGRTLRAEEKMSNNLLFEVLAEYIGGNHILTTDKYDVKINIYKAKSSFLSKRITYKINILVQFNTNEINYIAIAKSIYEYINAIHPHKMKSIYSNWFILSEQGGIYLYEEIAKKENKVYNKMHNHFLVINSNNGITSFGPGHIKNGFISEKLKGLLEIYRQISLQEWKNEVFKILELCREILERKI